MKALLNFCEQEHPWLHAADEHVTIADLPWRAALLAGLLRRILTA